MTDTLDRGFTDVPREAARAFRIVLEAMSRPGRVIASAPDIVIPAPLLPSTAAICLTLCDYDTPLWVDAPLRSPLVTDYLLFQTGAPLTHDAASAAFLLCETKGASEALAACAIGTPEYPDRSATLIIQIEAWSGGPAIRLSGPGIETHADIAPSGLDLSFWQAMQRNHALFPLGVDVILAARDAIAAVPRSSHIAALEMN